MDRSAVGTRPPLASFVLAIALLTPPLLTSPLFTSPLLADTLHVPADFATIQEAVDAASDGDVVEVAAGTYLENVDLGTRAITLRGAGMDLTTIDGSERTAGPDHGSVIRCSVGTTPATTIEDLTVTGGSGEVVPFSGPDFFGNGGGIYVPDGSPTIRRVRFVANTGDVGAGLYLRSTSAIELRECAFVDNLGEQGVGCAVFTPATLVVEDCSFVGNQADLYGAGAQLLGTTILVRNVEFIANVNAWQGGALHVVDAGNELPGSDDPVLEVEDCTFVGNAANHGACAVALSSSARFERCTHRANVGGWQYYLGGGEQRFERCSWSDTIAPSGLVTMTIGTTALFVDHCSLANIDTPSCFRTLDLPTVVRNTIAWNAFSEGIVSSPILSSVEYSVVEGGHPGLGNIDADPFFVDAASGDLRITPASPAIDSADPASPLDPDGTTADIGAFPVFQGTFRRGDANTDGALDLADPLRILGEFFFGEAPVPCRSAADANDDELVDLADPIYLLNFLFQGGPAVPAPADCGLDPTAGTFCETPDTGC